MSQLLRNVLSLYAVRLIGVAIAVVLFPLIVRSVGLTQAGIWLLVGSVSIFFSTSDFGLGTSVVKYVASARAREDNDGVNAVVSSSVACLAGLGALAGLGFAAFFAIGWGSFNIPPDDREVAMTVVAIVAVTQLAMALPMNVFRQVLTGFQRMDLTNGVTLLQTVLRAGLIVTALLLGTGIVGVVVAEAASVIVSSGIAAALCLRLMPGLRPRRDHVRVALLREMAPYSARVFLTGLAGLVVLQSSNAIVAAFMPVAAVALYGAAFRIYQVCRDITTALESAVVPDAADAYARSDGARPRDLMIRGTKYGNAVLLLIGVPAMVFAEPLLVHWVGPRFAEAAVVVQILMAGLLVNNNHLVAVGLLTGTGNMTQVTRYHVVWALSSVVLAMALVTSLELPGVALGIGLPLLVLEPLYLRLAFREFGIPAGRFVREAIGLPLLAATVAAAPLAMLVVSYHPFSPPGVAAATAAYALVFSIAFIRLGMNARERKRILRIRRFSVRNA